MGVILTLCDLDGNPLPMDWGIDDVLSANVIMTELDQFSSHSVRVSTNYRRNMAMMQPLQSVKIEQTDVGKIAWGLILKPELQLTTTGSVITLTLPNITDILTTKTTLLGWTVNDTIHNITAALGSMMPGWTAKYVGPDVALYNVRYENATPLGALVDLANKTGCHVRQDLDPITHEPLRALTLSPFGAPATITVLSGDESGNPDSFYQNPDIRIVDTMTRVRDGSNIVNAGIPLGSGTGTAQVDIGRLAQILFDPKYQYYGKYGAVAGSVFPDYDPWYGAIGYSPTLDGRTSTYMVNFDSYTAMSQNFGTTSALGSGLFWGNFTDSTFSYTDPAEISQINTERLLYNASKVKLLRHANVLETYTFTTLSTFRPPQAGDLVHVRYRNLNYDSEGYFVEWDVDLDFIVMKVTRIFDTQGNSKDEWVVSNLGVYGYTDGSIMSAMLKQMEALRVVPTNVPFGYALGPIEQSLSTAYPFTIPFWVPDDVYLAQKIQLAVDFKAARHNVAVAATGSHTHTITLLDHTHGVTLVDHTHTITLSDHTHPVTTSSHAHGVTTVDHSHTTSVGSHAHGVTTPDHSHSASLSGSTNTASAGTSSLSNAFNTHYHTMIISSGGTPGTLDNGGYLYVGGGKSHIQATANKQVQAETDPGIGYGGISTDHSHSATTSGGTSNGGGAGLGSTSAGGFAQGSTAAGASNLGSSSAGGQSLNSSGYGGTYTSTGAGGGTITSTGAGGGTLATTAGGDHSHNLTPGIFESFSPTAIFVLLDGTDITVEIGGPATGFTASFQVNDLLISKICYNVFNTKGRHVLSFVSQTNANAGLGAISVSGLFRYEVNGVSQTVLQA